VASSHDATRDARDKMQYHEATGTRMTAHRIDINIDINRKKKKKKKKMRKLIPTFISCICNVRELLKLPG
jgi:hypothetical protein